MKGGIGKDGDLIVERKGKRCKQGCPVDASDTAHCGDWCALFGEPHAVTIKHVSFGGRHGKVQEEPTGETRLALCKKELVFTEFTDEREES